MKKIIVPILFLLLSVISFAQPKFDLGIKGGINTSKISLNVDDYNSESILKYHIGAFGRIGWNRIFVQPEMYFSKKGGGIELNSNVLATAASFDFNTFDAPLLLGFNVIKGSTVSFHIVAGPVFSFITKSGVSGNLSEEYFEDHYIGVQYGLGIDVLFLTFDARMEHGGTVYSKPEIEGKNNTFMLSVGFKFL
ncbi:MAG: PorT family protein [Draconibacterium sp.]|nr:PorT family protein [Draconibacterium sp.]